MGKAIFGGKDKITVAIAQVSPVFWIKKDN